MDKFILNLRERPEHQRKRILFISLAISMSIIGGLWIYSLNNRFSREVTQNTKEEIKPFKLLGLKFKNTYQNMSASASKAKLRKDKVEVMNDIEKINVDETIMIDLIPVNK